MFSEDMCMLKMPTTTASATNMETNETPRGSLEDKDPPVSVDDDIDDGPAVKIYNNEAEDEEELQERAGGSRRDKIDKIEDDKSGLINESETSKDARHGGDQLAFASEFIHTY